MKTLNVIQKLSKAGKVLSKIIFIFCIIGFCGCIVGILSIAIGAPFDFGGAKELMRLGILAICIPIGTQMIAEIIYAVMEQTRHGVAPFQLDHSSSVALGVMFIVISLGCRYGAELREGKE